MSGESSRYSPRGPKAGTEPGSRGRVLRNRLGILIHPFPDGNGRCARLLAMLMGLQAGLPALDFGGVQRDKKRRYTGAVQAALGQDYAPMIRVFRRVIARTLRLEASA